MHHNKIAQSQILRRTGIEADKEPAVNSQNHLAAEGLFMQNMQNTLRKQKCPSTSACSVIVTHTQSAVVGEFFLT